MEALYRKDVWRRRFTWIFVCLFLLEIGIFHKKPAAMVLAEVLAGILIFSRLYLHVVVNSLSGSRSCPSRGVDGMPFSAKLEIRFRSWLPTRRLFIQDYFGADAWPERKRRFIISEMNLFRRQHAVQYTGHCRNGRGRFDIGPLQAIISDPLGLWCVEKQLIEKQQLLVLPSVVELTAISTGKSQTAYFASTRTSPKAGISYEFFGTREYRYGDNLKFIHWPATAHTGELIVKEFQLNTASRTTVFIDLWNGSLQGFKPHTTLDYAVKIAASIARYTISRGQEYRLIDDEEAGAFGKGDHHLQWVLERLAIVRPNRPQPLHTVLERSLPLIQPGEQIFIIATSHCLSITKSLDSFAIIRAKGAFATVVLLDSRSFETLRGYHIHKENANFSVAALQAQEVEVIPIAKGDDITRCFEGGRYR